jgi:hypothetical protein
MISGRVTTLTPSKQLDLAAWAALKAFVVEYALGDVIVATAEERRVLMDWKRPPNAVPIRVGAVERSGIPNSVTRILYNVGGQGRMEGFATCVTFALGCAVLQASYGLGITVDWTKVSEPRLDHAPINPPCARDIQWPPSLPLSAASLRDWERPIPAADPAAIALTGD